MSDLKVWKAMWEIRYPHAPRLFDNRGAIAARWMGQSDLTDWRISNNRVEIYNGSNSTFLRVGLQAIAVVMEFPERYTDFCEQATTFSVETMKTLDVRKIDRIGLRLLLIAERKNFKALVNSMREQLYRLEDDDWKVLGGYPQDVGFPLTLNVEDKTASFMLRPMEKDRLVGHFESNEVKEKLPAVALFLDFDLYEIEPRLHPKSFQKDLSAFLRSGGELIQDMSNRFVAQYGGF
jgi:hypothetical protein